VQQGVVDDTGVDARRVEGRLDALVPLNRESGVVRVPDHPVRADGGREPYEFLVGGAVPPWVQEQTKILIGNGRQSVHVTRHGGRLSGLATSEVVDRLRTETDGKAVKRLVAAREYLDGRSPAEIATKYGWPEQTVYGWLDRFEERDVEDALYDASPPGRPPSLSEAERYRFASALRNPPKDAGVDAQRWSTTLARRYLSEAFGHEFSHRHVRRLMADAEASDPG